MLLPECTLACATTSSSTFQETTLSAVIQSKEKEAQPAESSKSSQHGDNKQMAQGLGHIVIKQFGAPRTAWHHDSPSKWKEGAHSESST